MNWDQVVQKVTPYIVKIETPTGYGTGFLSFYNTDKVKEQIDKGVKKIIKEYSETLKMLGKE